MFRLLKIWCAIFVVGGLTLPAAAVLKFSNSYYSSRNRERGVRSSTSLIILHTTETASTSSALRKLRDNGECNYFIDPSGVVYRIIDHRRVAFHAGRSMWQGKTNLDNFSVGIETGGFHNKPLTRAQYQALAELIGELKYIYKIPDYRVLTHSQVAYGVPNKWHKRSHRGRKRCGMLLARPEVRALLNLKSRPLFDPDVKARRLVVGDVYLANVLYGSVSQKQQAFSYINAPDNNLISPGRSAWDIARDGYNASSTTYIFPGGAKKLGHQIADFRFLPSGTRVIVGAEVDNPTEHYQSIGQQGNAQDIAGAEVRLNSTIYVYPNGIYKRGHELTAADVLKLPYGTKVLVGYDVGGPISTAKLPSQICGGQWKSADTYFLIAGALMPGNKIDDKKIPSGAMIFYKK
ncbi:MAG: peptidoglycan recognition family protein [Kiritimatiellia bacterium]